MNYSYEIMPRPFELDGGWRLRLLQDGEEVGGGQFPVEQADPLKGMTWWDALPESQRAFWLRVAGSVRPSDAYRAFLLAKVYADAKAEACAWLDSREE